MVTNNLKLPDILPNTAIQFNLKIDLTKTEYSVDKGGG